VVTGQGSDANGSLTFVAAITFNADGSTSGTADFNDIANQFTGTVALASPSYVVDATGRVTVAKLIVNPLTPPKFGPVTLQLYLDGTVATSASMDTSDSFAGPAFEQTAGASLAGNYALNAFGISATTADPWGAVGQVSTDGSGVTDSNYLIAAHPIENVALSGMTSGGSATITGLGADSALPLPTEHVQHLRH
jgi:hypothetical protein